MTETQYKDSGHVYTIEDWVNGLKPVMSTFYEIRETYKRSSRAYKINPERYPVYDVRCRLRRL